MISIAATWGIGWEYRFDEPGAVGTDQSADFTLLMTSSVVGHPRLRMTFEKKLPVRFATTFPLTMISNCPRVPVEISTFCPVAFSIAAAKLAAFGLYEPQVGQ